MGYSTKTIFLKGTEVEVETKLRGRYAFKKNGEEKYLYIYVFKKSKKEDEVKNEYLGEIFYEAHEAKDDETRVLTPTWRWTHELSDRRFQSLYKEGIRQVVLNTDCWDVLAIADEIQVYSTEYGDPVFICKYERVNLRAQSAQKSKDSTMNNPVIVQPEIEPNKTKKLTIKDHLRIFFSGLIYSNIQAAKYLILVLLTLAFAPFLLAYYAGFKYTNTEIPKNIDAFFQNYIWGFLLALGAALQLVALVCFFFYLI